MKVLVFGITGLLGNAVFKCFSRKSEYDVWGTMRSGADSKHFPGLEKKILAGVDILDANSLVRVFSEIKPDAVVNCVGLVKQIAESNDPLRILPINSLFPHQLSNLCGLVGARLVHVSTDCVFSGKKGGYIESDTSDAEDLYGKSKFIGEVKDSAHAVTLRTSIIGHEPKTSHSLIDWFLGQQGGVRGYTKAIFSGLPTVELAKVIAEKVIPNQNLYGLYHVSSAPISKHDLLKLVATEYEKEIAIEPDDRLVLDRSLNSEKFRNATGYVAPAWVELIKNMRQFQHTP